MKRFLTLSTTFLMLIAIYYGVQLLGYNITDSVPFRVYYHTNIDESDIKQGNYILFDMPATEFYPADIKAVKKIACIAGQSLSTEDFYYGVTNYYCDGVLISSLTIKTDLYGEKLSIFDYSGVIPDGYVFVVGSSENSYDSKYWGFLDTKRIKRLVHPITFNFFSEAQAATYDLNEYQGYYQYAVIKDNKTDNKTRKAVVMPSIPWNELMTIHTDDFAELFEEVKKVAMTDRTLENFEIFAKMRSVMSDRAMEFMNVGTLWAQLNPEETTESWHPTSTYGQMAYQKEVQTIKMDYIKQNADEYALLYLYRIDCAFCQKQAPIIKYFEDETNWRVKRIDVDMFPEALIKFKTKSVPTLVLLERKTERSILVSSGLMTLEEINDRLYRMLKYLKGESDEKNFTNPIRTNFPIIEARKGTR